MKPHSISMSFGCRALLMCRMRQLSATRLSLGWTRDENMACIACDTDCSALDEGTEMSDTLKFRVAHYCKVWRSDRALCAADVAPTCSHVAGSSGKAYRALPDRWLHRRSIPHFGRTPQDKLGQPSCNAGPRINWRNSFDTAGAAWSTARFSVPGTIESLCDGSASPSPPGDGKRVTGIGNNLPTISDSNATRVETARTRPKIDLMRPKFLPSMHGPILRRHASRIQFTIGTGSALHLLMAGPSLVKV